MPTPAIRRVCQKYQTLRDEVEKVVGASLWIGRECDGDGDELPFEEKIADANQALCQRLRTLADLLQRPGQDDGRGGRQAAAEVVSVLLGKQETNAEKISTLAQNVSREKARLRNGSGDFSESNRKKAVDLLAWLKRETRSLESYIGKLGNEDGGHYKAAAVRKLDGACRAGEAQLASAITLMESVAARFDEMRKAISEIKSCKSRLGFKLINVQRFDSSVRSMTGMLDADEKKRNVEPEALAENYLYICSTVESQADKDPAQTFGQHALGQLCRDYETFNRQLKRVEKPYRGMLESGEPKRTIRQIRQRLLA